MTLPEQADSPRPAAAEATASALVENAGRLGLTWDLKPATVTTINPLTVTFDDDTVSVGATSMIGWVAPAARVYVLVVPPSGNFITGTVGPGTSRVGARIRRVAAQSLPSGGGATVISWDTTDSETGGNFITVPSTTITIPPGQDGVYGISVSVLTSGLGGTRNFTGINITSAIPGVNGTPFRASYDAGEGFVATHAIVPLLAGDRFTVDVFQNSGSAQTFTATLFVTRVAD